MMQRRRSESLQTVHRRWRVHAVTILVYTLLALVLTWPLATAFDPHVPGNGADDPPLTWNLWWVRYALLDLGANPFDCDYLFYPLGINLAFYTLTVLNSLLSIPLQAVMGLVPASNLLLLSSFVLSAYGAYLLAVYLVARNSSPDTRIPASQSLFAPFVAGLLWQLTRQGEWREKLTPDRMREVLRYANAVGALTALALGVIPALPTAEQVEEFLGQAD